MKIEIAVSCHYFEKRLCWFISSLFEQKGDMPEVLLNIAHARGTGTPSVEDVFNFYGKENCPTWLTIMHTPYEGTEKLQYRGLVRNDVLFATDADYVWFADCDMVWHPDTLATFKEFATKNPKVDNVMTSRRYSTFLEPTERLVNILPYPTRISGVYDIALKRLNSIPKSNIGAGYCQIVSMYFVKTKNRGLYVDPNHNKDWSWKKIQKARSDKQFRKSMGGITKVPLPPFIHLQHRRDNEVGHHIEEQR